MSSMDNCESGKFCSSEELQEYLDSEGNRIIWSILYKYARGLEMEDAYQEICLDVATALAVYDGTKHNTKKSTFIYQCAYNRVKMLLRSNATNRRTFERESASAEEQVNLKDTAVSMEDEVVDRMIADERANMLWDAVRKADLSSDERAVIQMTLNDMYQMEIGRKMGTSQGRVSKLKHSAMAKLKKFLQDSGWDNKYSYISQVA